MPFQSETTKPSKPIFFFSTSVEQDLLAAVHLAASSMPSRSAFVQLLNDAITRLRAGRERAVVAAAVHVAHVRLG